MASLASATAAQMQRSKSARWRQRGLFPSGLIVVVALTSRTAFAQPIDAPRAAALYDEALALADVGRHAEACPKFEESQRLEPALGTQFNLADCYEHVGKIATAFALFGEVERAAGAAGKLNLRSRAHESAERLTARVPRMRIVLERPERSLDVKIDGARVDAEAAAGAGVAVDPGVHELTLIAPGKSAWYTQVTVAEGHSEVIRVPPLADAVPQAFVVRVRSPAMTATAISLAGAGVVSAGVGAVFGVVMLSKRSEARDKCMSDDPKDCKSREAVPLWGDAKDAGTLSTIAFVAGGALLAAGAIVWFATAPGKKPERATVTGAVTPDAASIGLRGSW